MSECGCLYSGADEDNDFECRQWRTAAKDHRCSECRRAITRGEKYEIYTTKSDGTIHTTKTCAECSEIRDTFYCDGFYFGRLWSDVEEQMFDHGPLNSACLDKLVTVAAKQFLQRRWWQWVEARAGGA